MRLSESFLILVLLGLARGYEDKTVYQYLVDNGYSEFVKLLNDVNLQGQLTGQGPFTVFAPTNTALANMDPAFSATVAANKLQRKMVVKYHIAANFLLVPQVRGQMSVDTLAGQAIDVVHVGSSLVLNNVSRVDSSPNNDIICNNGIVQPVDTVLRPPVFGTDDIAAVLVERDDLFQEFFMSILLSNMTSIFKTGEYTLFAPIDAAFVEISKTIFGSHIPIEKRIEIYTEVVKYHMVPGERTSGMLQNGQQLFTLHGTPVNITVSPNGVMVNNAHVVTADIAASNGVVHAIDHLLFPPDMLAELQKLYLQYRTTTASPSG